MPGTKAISETNARTASARRFELAAKSKIAARLFAGHNVQDAALPPVVILLPVPTNAR
jgi:hypothetical protein